MPTNPFDRFDKTNPFDRFDGPTREQLSAQVHAAERKGDTRKAAKLMGIMQAHGMKLIPLTPAQEQAAYQAKLASNVAAMPWYEKVALGAGHGFAQLMHGGEHIGDKVLDAIAPRQGLSRLVALSQQQQANAPARNALMASPWAKAGSIGAQVAASLPLTAGAGLAADAAGVGAKALPFVANAAGNAALSGLEPTQGSHAWNALVGGTLGLAGEGASRGLSRLAAKGVPLATRDLIDTARKFHIPLRMTDTSHSPPLEMLGAVTHSVPFTGTKAALRNQRNALNRALLGDIEQEGTDLTPEALAKAKAETSKGYQDLFANHKIDYTKARRAMRDVQAFERQTMEELKGDPAAQRKFTAAMARYMVPVKNGKVSGAQFQLARKAASRTARGTTDAAPYIGELRALFDKVAEKGLPEDAAKQYRHLQELTKDRKALETATSGEQGAGYDLSSAKLRSQATGKFGVTPTMGRLSQLASLIGKGGNSSHFMDKMLRIEPWLLAGGVLGGVGTGHEAATALGAAGLVGLGRFVNSDLAARYLPFGGSKLAQFAVGDVPKAGFSLMDLAAPTVIAAHAQHQKPPSFVHGTAVPSL